MYASTKSLSIVLLSLMLYGVHSYRYFRLGSEMPAYLLASFLLVAIGFIVFKRYITPVKVWAVLMMGWGMVRTALMVLVYSGDLSDHIVHQLTIGFIAINVLTILGGIYLYRNARSMLAFFIKSHEFRSGKD